MKNVHGDILFICSGAGHVHRGYETHMTDLFDILNKDGSSNLFFLKGGGINSENSKRIYCIKRNSLIAKLILKISGKPEYLTEQISFFFASIIFILKNKPSIIYCADVILLRLYVILKRIFKMQYKTILCNGGNYKPPYFGIDKVQFVLEEHAKKVDFENKVIIPHGFDCTKYSPRKTKNEYREALGLPQGKKIVLSVGAINSSIKRMDYLINEISTMDDENVFLLILGQRDRESDFIENLAMVKLRKNYLIKTVTYEKIPDYYNASDIFCSASLNETFGKSYIEAALTQLPIIVHDFSTSRQVTGNYANYIDMKGPFMFKKILTDMIYSEANNNVIQCESFVKFNFCWENLLSRYKAMLFNN